LERKLITRIRVFGVMKTDAICGVFVVQIAGLYEVCGNDRFSFSSSQYGVWCRQTSCPKHQCVFMKMMIDIR